MRRGAAALLVVSSCITIPDLVTGGDGAAEAGLDATVEGGGAGDAGVDGTATTDAEAGATDAADSGDGALACPGTYRDAVMAIPQLLGYWRLDEDAGTVARDQTGKHAGTYGGGVLLGQPSLLTGDPDPSAGFDGGAGAFVDVPAAKDLDLTSFTLGALVRPSAFVDASDGQQIVAKELSYWLQLRPPGNLADHPHLEVGIITDAGDFYPYTPSAYLGVGTVSLAVGTYDGQTIHVYVDGQDPVDVPVGFAILPSGNDLFVGTWDKATHMQTGLVDEVFVAGAAVDAATVKRLWLAAQGCAYAGGG